MTAAWRCAAILFDLDGVLVDSRRCIEGIWRTWATLRLGVVGLPIPDVFVTAEAVHRGKPAPDGYLAAAAQLRLAPAACVAIEDSPPGVAGARSAGMRVMAVLSTHQERDLGLADARLPALDHLRATPTREPEGIVLEWRPA